MSRCRPLAVVILGPSACLAFAGDDKPLTLVEAS